MINVNTRSQQGLSAPLWKGLWIYICIIYHRTWWGSPETLLLFDLTPMSISIFNVHWPELVSSWSYSIFTQHVSLYFPPLLSWLPLLYPPNEDTSIQMTAILHATAKHKWVSSEHRPLRWLLFILGLPPCCALRINAPTIYSPFGSLHKRHDWSNWVHNSGSVIDTQHEMCSLFKINMSQIHFCTEPTNICVLPWEQQVSPHISASI